MNPNNYFLPQLKEIVKNNPQAVMVEQHTSTNDVKEFSAAEIWGSAQALSEELNTTGQRIAIVMNNSAEWLIADLAIGLCEKIVVPIPLVFSAEQAQHLLQGIDCVLVDNAGLNRLNQWKNQNPNFPQITGKIVNIEQLKHKVDSACFELLPKQDVSNKYSVNDVSRIIHTSGTTGTPKGVQITHLGLSTLLKSLQSISNPDHYKRYLSIVPLSLLIEQVAMYQTLLNGGIIIFLPQEIPMIGTAGGNPLQILDFVNICKPTVVNFPPIMVEALWHKTAQNPCQENPCQALFGTNTPPLIFSGGAPIDSKTITNLTEKGIPVYQGYGLSENTSLVSINHPGVNKIGTVGKPLPHVTIKLSVENELLIKGDTLTPGYTNSDTSSCLIDDEGFLHTGDIVKIDGEGFLHILGRKKNLIILSTGGNVSPEWLEAQYRTLPEVVDIVVFGNNLPHLIGVVVIEQKTSPKRVKNAIQKLGKGLAQTDALGKIITITTAQAAEYFTPATGRPMRTKIWEELVLPEI
jgi:long-subunit acyl-CoA synthetase (AMP-forming)